MSSPKNSPLLKLKFLEAYKRNRGRLVKTCQEIGVDDTTIREWEKDDRPLIEVIESPANIPLEDKRSKKYKSRVKEVEDLSRLSDKTSLSPFIKKTFAQAMKLILLNQAERIESRLIEDAEQPGIKNTLARIFYLKHSELKKYHEGGGGLDSGSSPVPLWFEGTSKPVPTKGTPIPQGGGVREDK